MAAGGSCIGRRVLVRICGTACNPCTSDIKCPEGMACSIDCPASGCAGAIDCRDATSCTVRCGRERVHGCSFSAAAARVRSRVCGSNSCRGGVTGAGSMNTIVCSGTGSCRGRVSCSGMSCQASCSGPQSCAMGVQADAGGEQHHLPRQRRVRRAGSLQRQHLHDRLHRLGGLRDGRVLFGRELHAHAA